MAECMSFEEKINTGKRWMESIDAGIDPSMIILTYKAWCAEKDYEDEFIDIITLGLSEHLIEEVSKQVTKSYESNMDKFVESSRPTVAMISTLCNMVGHPEAASNILPARQIVAQALIKAGERMLSGEKT